MKATIDQGVLDEQIHQTTQPATWFIVVVFRFCSMALIAGLFRLMLSFAY